MHILIGVDDTDNLESRGTGHLARMLGQHLSLAGLAQMKGITRHQLLVSPEIPYTSHNSSACLEAEIQPENRAAVMALCRHELLTESAPGSDAGLCVAAWNEAETVCSFGGRAKLEVLKQDEALALGRSAGIDLEGLTGTGGGVIGALAAVGLRAAGNDGRFLWLPGLRDPQEVQGRCSVRRLDEILGPGAICTPGGQTLAPDAWVDIGDWPRPLLRGGRAVLLVEENPTYGPNEWRVIAKENIKQLSQ